MSNRASVIPCVRRNGSTSPVRYAEMFELIFCNCRTNDLTTRNSEWVSFLCCIKARFHRQPLRVHHLYDLCMNRPDQICGRSHVCRAGKIHSQGFYVLRDEP